MSSPERIPYAGIEEHLRSHSCAALPALNLAVLRNVVVETIEPCLRFNAYEIGFNGACKFGGYDNVFQEAVGGDSDLLNDRTDCVLVFLRLETLSWDLARNFAGMNLRQVEAETQRIQELVASVVRGIREQTTAMILWHGFELPLYPALGIADYQQSSGQTAVVEGLNSFVRATLQKAENGYFVDLNACIARIGAKSFYDLRYWHIGKAPYSLAALEEISREIFRYVRPLKGKNKKCLVLDCDNVLWGGIIGEDGLAGIKLGKTYPGSAYRELQQEILNLHNRGIVLALCSRNNEPDVWEVFDKHPDMLLRREHIAAACINWHDKATNLKELAAGLQLSLDSFVLLDDSPFESSHVRNFLPEVDVIQMPSQGAVQYRDILAAYPGFDTLIISDEDKRRGPMYRDQFARKEQQARTVDLPGYLRSLEMVLEVRLADAFTIPRIAQLTQKTNQFNLTTPRYSEAEIRKLHESDSADVIHAQLKDRFGESGITAVCILKYEPQHVVIDTFLLSCRVLGRGVEDAFLACCLQRAKQRRSIAVGHYYPTVKNTQVSDFYLKHGFSSADNDRRGRSYTADLGVLVLETPDFFKDIVAEI